MKKPTFETAVQMLERDYALKCVLLETAVEMDLISADTARFELAVGDLTLDCLRKMAAAMRGVMPLDNAS